MPRDIEKNIKNAARYLVFLHGFYGDLITNLKVQKLMYYVYVWNLVGNKNRCFREKFQAWPSGPVLYSLYFDLKGYGSLPINPNYSEISNEKSLQQLKSRLGKLVHVIDSVYERYAIKSAFELVNLTHNELPWVNARKGLNPSAPSSKEISDRDILNYYGKKEQNSRTSAL
jgi:uncharacterized phage-associated protein